ncbi:MAG: transporter suffix domain-containing protein [Candidatus Syntrophopropionicum ammoniitolerans]
MNDCSQQEQQAPAGEKPVGSPWMKKLGILLVALSFVLYGGILLAPFTPFATATKAVITTGLIITGETSFWLGALLLGKEIVAKYKRYLNPLQWFKKQDSRDN